eukprot:4748178-Amphidinium_carterae.1
MTAPLVRTRRPIIGAFSHGQDHIVVTAIILAWRDLSSIDSIWADIKKTFVGIRGRTSTCSATCT